MSINLASIHWRSRFFLLLIPCVFGLLLVVNFRTHAETTGAVLTPPIIVGGDVLPSPKILLVSAFFPLAKSKHTLRDYEMWLSQFLKPISTDIYFYAPPEMEALVRKCRGDLPITINTTFASPFDVAPLNGTRERYDAMHVHDRERGRHSPELYAVWNAKPYFLDAAVKTLTQAGKDYDFAFWNDAGSFRAAHKYAGWPDPARVREVWDEGSSLSGEKAEDLVFFPLAGIPDTSFKFWTQDFGPVDNEISEGSFFGGAPRAIAWWRSTFYAYHDHYLALDIFVGKDQTLINALFLLFPSRFINVWLDDPAAPAHTGRSAQAQGGLGNCGPEWFYYQFWLSSRSVQDAMRTLWNKGAWLPWHWGRTRTPCRETRVITMKDLLQWRFGNAWAPPQHTIDT
ncbi:hypothetical protein B0H15DRAFT_916511 [Mycena belliarum]|uniref:Uncharacterized protein n=1 Tax=Mycena belliarum TaxID=1033014 RepID=A0AAD6XJW9_9AGAR|nr:hypothetical protein B0H15DRAFT_916511 [Mycena belliae]